ncbi:MAG: enoyl-CoA hydratase [Stellaceae bacterium]
MDARDKSPADDAILLRQDTDGIARLTLNRPAARNALSVALMDALQCALDAIARDDTVKVVVIGANGPGFCAGHDLREMRANPGRQHYQAVFSQCARLMTGIVRLPKPVIARVHGIATAAGCQLVASCDLAVASSAARFATSGINLGLFCATPAVAVTRNLSRKSAFELLFTGEFLSAERACELGLVNRVVAPEALDETVAALARSLAAKPRDAVRAGKALFYRQLGRPTADAYVDAGAVMAANLSEADAIEGIDAFLEKRSPRWRG